jgi:uncharacterized protein YjhX (UPF0386 family)
MHKCVSKAHAKTRKNTDACTKTSAYKTIHIKYVPSCMWHIDCTLFIEKRKKKRKKKKKNTHGNPYNIFSYPSLRIVDNNYLQKLINHEMISLKGHKTFIFLMNA